jgi:glucose-6-phosphate isomerase
MAGTTIADADAWKALFAHSAEMSTHLRDMVGDEARRASLTTEGCGFVFDYSRQNATAETKNLLLALAREAGLEAKKVGNAPAG